MRVLYFARLRQLAGRASEEVSLPVDVTTVAALIDYLSARDEAAAAAFADRRTLKVAVNQKHAGLDASLAGATEVAFFPPVTGG